MKSRALLPLCLLLLLWGCARQEPYTTAPVAQALPLAPGRYRCVYQLEASADGRQTSLSRFSMLRSEEGFCISADGQQWLLYREGDRFVCFVADPDGQFSALEGVTLSADAAERLQSRLLPLGISSPAESGLTDGGTALYGNRLCRVLLGETADPVSSSVCFVDLATGLTLYHRAVTADTDGRILLYELTCRDFSTEHITLPRPDR